MPDKQELEEKLNEVLGTEMEWSKMKKDDLELMYELVDTGELVEPILKNLAKDHSKKKVDELIDEWYPGKYAGGLL